jgi:excisionase family DNA binding protein
VTREELLAVVARTAIDDLPAMLGVLVEVEERIRLRLRSVKVATDTTTDPDVNISVEDAARRLGVSTSYVYKNAKTLPFVVKIGRRIVCSAAALERWISSRPRA